MAIDLNNAYDSVEEKIKAGKTYIQVKKDTSEIIKKQKDNLEKAKESVTTTVDNLKNQQKRFQRQVKTQFDQLLSVFQFNSGSGPETFQYLKKKFIQAALIVQPKIFEILTRETIHALGCSQQQAYDGTQVVYVKVKSVDIQRLLQRDPTGENASLSYEKTPPTPNTIPYSMNREMWERLQNLNVPVDYYGASGQKLFEISYVQTDGNGNSGDFYKIALTNRVNGLNTVSNFIVDYYKSINILDTTNIFAQLMDQISGAVSFDANVGSGELDEKNKFLLLLQRILGLCFDSKKEIDVSGNSKIAELDGVDDSFFEFTDIDLRYIDQLVSNIQNGVVEFEDCQNVLLPVDSQSIIDSLIKFNKSNNELEAAQQLTNALTDNEKWKFLIPNSVDIKLSVDLSFLTNLPKAIMMTLLSPKVLLPLMIMAKAIGQSIGDFVESLLTLIKHFKKYVIKIMAEIGGLFVKELFDLIKKDIRTLIDDIIKDISKEKTLKKYVIVLRLIELILIVAKFVDDWKKCKSVVDEILSLLSLAGKSLGIGSKVPSFLLAASQLLDGFSNTRATINIIQEFQKLGLPTGPMPDGSPNLTLQSEVARVKGIFQEASENGKTQVFIKPLTITPAGVTLPTGDTFGKWY